MKNFLFYFVLLFCIHYVKADESYLCIDGRIGRRVKVEVSDPISSLSNLKIMKINKLDIDKEGKFKDAFKNEYNFRNVTGIANYFKSTKKGTSYEQNNFLEYESYTVVFGKNQIDLVFDKTLPENEQIYLRVLDNLWDSSKTFDYNMPCKIFTDTTESKN